MGVGFHQGGNKTIWGNNKYFLSIYLVFFFNLFLYFISLQILSVCLTYIYYIYLYISTMPLSREPRGLRSY